MRVLRVHNSIQGFLSDHIEYLEILARKQGNEIASTQSVDDAEVDALGAVPIRLFGHELMQTEILALLSELLNVVLQILLRERVCQTR